MIHDLYTMTVVQQELATRRREAAAYRQARAIVRQRRAERPTAVARFADRVAAWVDGEPLLRRPALFRREEECVTC